jgi:hypothetical protein
VTTREPFQFTTESRRKSLPPTVSRNWLPPAVALGAVAIAQKTDKQMQSSQSSEEGLGRAHMDISCSPEVAASFDRALALLHNFWYSRALQGFQQVSNDDPGRAIAYWMDANVGDWVVTPRRAKRR